MRICKKLIALLCGLTLLISAFPVNANNDPALFTDVQADYWAYDAIKVMADNKIMVGSNNYFRPEDMVTRAEFAKVLTLALDLPLKEPTKPTFKDVFQNNWAYKYAETAKYYLTGYRTTAGDYFKPTDFIVKEDMAVALVKALDYGGEAADESALNNLKDKDTIAKNLRKYVAVAIKHGIIETEPIENSELRLLSPKASLTRAKVAVYLSRVLQEEKVTYDEEKTDNKVTYDEDKPESNDEYVDKAVYAEPKVSVSTDTGRVVLKWQKINDERLQGYKVVVSQKDSTPSYPENGYLYWITDKNRTSAIIDNSTPYNYGDFGKYLKAGEKYYLSVTAVYDGLKVPGNTVRITYPEASDKTVKDSVGRKVTSLTYKIEDGKLVLNWNKVSSENFVYYKVVISKNNSAPKYPEDGYLYYFTDVNKTSTGIDTSSCYNGGDISGYLDSGEEYYFSITAVYQDDKVAGSVVRIKIP